MVMRPDGGIKDVQERREARRSWDPYGSRSVDFMTGRPGVDRSGRITMRPYDQNLNTDLIPS